MALAASAAACGAHDRAFTPVSSRSCHPCWQAGTRFVLLPSIDRARTGATKNQGLAQTGGAAAFGLQQLAACAAAKATPRRPGGHWAASARCEQRCLRSKQFESRPESRRVRQPGFRLARAKHRNRPAGADYRRFVDRLFALRRRVRLRPTSRSRRARFRVALEYWPFGGAGTFFPARRSRDSLIASACACFPRFAMTGLLRMRDFRWSIALQRHRSLNTGGRSGRCEDWPTWKSGRSRLIRSRRKSATVLR